jgi:DNA-binding transcriptional ArsR family regulator
VVVDAFHALAEPRKRRIIEIVARQGKLSASQIYSEFDVTPQAVSQHLKVLLDADLLTMEKKSQQHIYKINPEPIVELERWLSDTRQLWNERLDNLDEVLQAEKRRGPGIER